MKELTIRDFSDQTEAMKQMKERGHDRQRSARSACRHPTTLVLGILSNGAYRGFCQSSKSNSRQEA